MAVVAFIGLGNMGLPMARNLAKAGHEVRGNDVVDNAKDALEDAGGQFFASIAEAVAGAEVVITMLPAGTHVREVYTGAEGVMTAAKPGTLFIDCSTIDVDTAREVAKAAADKGFAMVDAPVSGGVGGAEAGTLTFMVGGPDAAFESAKPYLEIMGGKIVHAGGPGNGEAAKICNNLILGISMIGVSEAFALAHKLGLEDQTLFDISSTASGQCWSLTSYCPVPGPVPNSPANRDYKAGFTAAMMLKDLKLAGDAAQSTGSKLDLGDLARKLYDDMADAGHGGVDFSGIIKRIEGTL